MNFYPAIDIKDGKFIRLKQGSLENITVYGDEPVKVAQKFCNSGAKWLHVVDIDGAFKGESINHRVILNIKKNVSCKVQVGGGIRDKKTAKFYLDNNIDRVVLGTAALNNQSLVKELCKNYPEKIAVGIDAKNGIVAIEGWSRTSSLRINDLAKSCEDMGVSCVVFTDIEKDGLMQGVSETQLSKLLKRTKLKVIASGGVSSLDDLKSLKKIKKKNLIGVISGKAIYEKKFTVKEAIKLLEF